MPGILYYPKTTGLQKSVEDTVQKCIRKFITSSHVADRADAEFFESVRPVLQATSSLPQEKISTLIILVVTSPNISFTDKLGNQSTPSSCLLVPSKDTGVVILAPSILEAWLSQLEEAVNLRCNFDKQV